MSAKGPFVEGLKAINKPNAKWSKFHEERHITLPEEPIIGPEDKVYTIGSCFAEYIRYALADQGVKVLPDFSRSEVDMACCRIENLPKRPHLSYYNTFTIRQELERSIGEWQQEDDDYWEVKDSWWGGKTAYQDPYKRAVFGKSTKHLSAAVKIANSAIDSGLREATAVFITLGMAEVFVNKSSGKVVCQKPLYGRGGGEKESELYLSSFKDNYENLVKIVECLRKINPKMKVVVTVSPVALERTFSGEDIAVANCEGKSILRAAAGQLSRDIPGVTYFPSYEAAMGMGPAAFYETDGRHVNKPVVDTIMKSFMASRFSEDYKNESDPAHVKKSSPVKAASSLFSVISERILSKPSKQIKEEVRMTNSNMDNVLIEAREASIEMEMLACRDIQANYSSYFPPSPSVVQLLRRYEVYCKSHNSTDDDYRLMRKAFSETMGASNRGISGAIANNLGLVGTPDFSKTIFPEPAKMMAIVRHASATIEKYGFYKPPFYLPERLVTSLRESLIEQWDASSGGKGTAAMKKKSDAAPQLKSNSDWLLAQRELYEFACDPFCTAVASEYFGVPAILNNPVSFLNSCSGATTTKELSALAQLYHHDLDRMKFLKLFVYLTDVGENDGPHALIPGSHRHRPHALWADGRHEDKDLEKNGVLSDEKRILGKAGTMFFVDTSALHKGIHPTNNPRLMLQVQFTNSLFGSPIPDSNRKITMAQIHSDPLTDQAAELVRDYATRGGVRLMQNYI